MSKKRRIAELKNLLDRKKEAERKVCILPYLELEEDRERQLAEWEAENGVTDDDDVFVIYIRGIKPDPERFAETRDYAPTRTPSNQTGEVLSEPAEPLPRDTDEPNIVQQLQRNEQQQKKGLPFHLGGEIDTGNLPAPIRGKW